MRNIRPSSSTSSASARCWSICDRPRRRSNALAWLKPGGIIQLEVPSSRWLIARLVNLYYRLRGTRFVTNISPVHGPYHLYEFGLRSFALHGDRAGYDVAENRYLVCSIPHVPRGVHPPLGWLMERTGTGMQLSAYLRKRDADPEPDATAPRSR